MTSAVATTQPPTGQPKPPRKGFLGSVKSFARSISGNNQASKPKKQEKQPPPQRPPPEKLIKGRRRASSVWAKKPKPPYYGDTQDLRYSSADQLASTLRDSFRAIGFQDITPYDNPALGNISRQSSASRLSINPLATPNMPTIIFSSTPPRSPSLPFAPSPLAGGAVSPSPSPSLYSRPSSRPPSRPGTPGTMELRFDIPTFLPPPPKHHRNGSSSSSDFASLRGTPRGSTVSLPQHHRASYGIGAAAATMTPGQSPVRGSVSLPFLHASTQHRAATIDTSSPSKSSYDGSSIYTTGATRSESQHQSQPPQQQPHPPTALNTSASILLNSPPKTAPSPLRESPITAPSPLEQMPNLDAQVDPRTSEQTETGEPPEQHVQVQEQSQSEEPLSPLARPTFPHLDEQRPVSTASDLSARGMNRILTGFDEVDAQLQEMLTQRGRELSDAVGSPEPPKAPIAVAL